MSSFSTMARMLLYTGSGAMMTSALFAVSAWIVAPPALNPPPPPPPPPAPDPLSPSDEALGVAADAGIPVAGAPDERPAEPELLDEPELSDVGALNCNELPPL